MKKTEKKTWNNFQSLLFTKKHVKIVLEFLKIFTSDVNKWLKLKQIVYIQELEITLYFRNVVFIFCISFTFSKLNVLHLFKI